MRLHFLAMQFDDELIAAGVRVPVNMAEVIAGLILAVILEIHRTTRAAAEAFAAHAAHRRVRQAQRVTQSRLFAVNQALAEWGLHELQMAWLLQML